MKSQSHAICWTPTWNKTHDGVGLEQGNRRIAKTVKRRHSCAEYEPPPRGLVAIANQASQRDEPA